MQSSDERSRGTRQGESSSSLCDGPLALIRADSPRQLPTDDDHDGGPKARSANIRVINRRLSPLDRRSLKAEQGPGSLERGFRWA